MDTTFIPSWSISVLLVILCGIVAWALIDSSAKIDEAVDGETDPLCGDEVEIDDPEVGQLIISCRKTKGHVEDGDPEHEAWTTDADNESVYFNTWTWTWER